jgi:hypothetical protein
MLDGIASNQPKHASEHIGASIYDGVDAPRRHRCAKVEVLSTT